MCGAAAEQSITKSRNSGGVRSRMVRAKKDHLKDVRTLASFVCVHVAGNKIQKSCFLLVYSFFSPPHNAEWGQRSQPEPRECVQRGDEAKNKQVLEKKRTGSLLRRKKELCPVAGTQTGWFG